MWPEGLLSSGCHLGESQQESPRLHSWCGGDTVKLHTVLLAVARFYVETIVVHRRIVISNFRGRHVLQCLW